jgi:bacterioferritin B
MINERLRDFFIDQVSHELTAHQDYMGISLYFQHQSLLRWTRLFRDQAIEEAQHATKIMDFLVDNEVPFDVPPLSGATSQFDSALAATKAALEWERAVTERFRTASQLALDEGDATSHEFLQWFIAEQVEEEAKMLQLIDLIESGINLFQAEPLLDALEGDN